MVGSLSVSRAAVVVVVRFRLKCEFMHGSRVRHCYHGAVRSQLVIEEAGPAGPEFATQVLLVSCVTSNSNSNVSNRGSNSVFSVRFIPPVLCRGPPNRRSWLRFTAPSVYTTVLMYGTYVPPPRVRRQGALSTPPQLFSFSRAPVA